MNRSVIGFTANANVLNNTFDFLFNWRNARETYSGKFIENIMRVEGTYNTTKNLQFKALALYRNYPLTKGNTDPFLRSFDNRYTDTFMLNNQITDGKNCDLATYAIGGKYDMFERKVTVYGVFEATNDPQDFPRRELNNKLSTGTAGNNDSSVMTVDNINMFVWQDFLYSQDLFGMPNFPYYGIIKGCISVKPVDQVTIKYTHVTNTNRNYAALFDANNTHDGIELIHKVTKNLTWTSGYVVSRVIDLRRSINTWNTNNRDRKFESHSNVYSKIDWDFKKDQNLTILFGEQYVYEDQPGVFGTKWASTQTSVLDTRPIVRFYYQGKF